MREHEEFAVETDEPGEEAMPFWNETVTRVVVEVAVGLHLNDGAKRPRSLQ